MKKIFSQQDLSGWLSEDEQRLIDLFRAHNATGRQHVMFRMMQERLIHMITAEYDSELDRTDPDYLSEKLDRWLMEICPVHLLGDYLYEEPHLGELIRNAWDTLGEVILGASENDGARADELYNTAVRIWDSIGYATGHRSPLSISRGDALRFIETWRTEAMSAAMRDESGD